MLKHRSRHAERRQVIASIGPVWDGNEVWLLAAAGTYFAFPQLYASPFRGFYLPLLSTPDDRLLLAIFYGAALGDVVRGMPLDTSRYFVEPLWTNFRLRSERGFWIGTRFWWAFWGSRR